MTQKQQTKSCKLLPAGHRECDEEEKMPTQIKTDNPRGDNLYDNLKNNYLQLLIKFMEDTHTVMSVNEAEKIVDRSVQNHLQHRN